MSDRSADLRVICNSRNLPDEEKLVGAFASEVGSKIIAYIPRSGLVQHAELNNQTVIEFAPDSPLSATYQSLAEEIMTNTDFVIPKPLEIEELEKLARSYLPTIDHQGINH